MSLARVYCEPVKMKKLNKVSLGLLAHLVKHTDHDSLVHIDLQKYNRKLSLMYRTSAIEAINGLVREGYYTWKSGQLYSNCNFVFDPKEKGFRYVPNLEFMIKSDFMNLTKRQMNFLYYLLFSQKVGNFHVVNIESLYQNKLKKENVGFDFFYSYEDFRNWIVPLIEKGILLVKLMNANDKVLNNKTKNLYDEFDRYCDKIIGRKKRVTSILTHPIAIAFSPESLKVENGVGPYIHYLITNSHEKHINRLDQELTSLCVESDMSIESLGQTLKPNKIWASLFEFIKLNHNRVVNTNTEDTTQKGSKATTNKWKYSSNLQRNPRVVPLPSWMEETTNEVNKNRETLSDQKIKELENLLNNF